MATYFALDGSYGDAHGLFIVDTNNWTDHDWDRVECADDNDRGGVAITIEMEKWS